MSEDDVFDVIVVGGGISGLTTAYVLAKNDLSVVLIERGNFCGSKNMTGGRLYTHSIEMVFPNFAEEAPVERLITREVITTLTEDSAVGFEYVSPASLNKPGARSYSVLSGPLCQWLAKKCEEEGVEFVTGVTVTDLVVETEENGPIVKGVKAGEEELRAHVTVLAEGANSYLTQKIGLRGFFKPWELGVGIKETIALPSSVIEDRFHCEKGEGTANLFVGSPTDGYVGGAFIYTNRESISIGITANIYRMVDGNRSVPAMLEAFKNHPAVAPLIAGGELVEYTGRLVPEGGYYAVTKILENGVVVVGDAAGYCMNTGYTVRGMDLAVESAICAATGVYHAIRNQDYTRQFLLAYRGELEKSPAIKDMKMAGKIPRWFDDTPELFFEIPEAFAGVARELFVVDREKSGRELENVIKAGIQPALGKHYLTRIGNIYKKLIRAGDGRFKGTAKM